MSHVIPPKASLWPMLFLIDVSLRDDARARGCPFCGGRLDRADYARKARGGPHHRDDEVFCRRLSLCCAAERCRRRTLPPSTRFLGRRVYLGVIVALVAALRQGPSPQRMLTLIEAFGVDRRTVERWGRWWREGFAKSPGWRLGRGRLSGSDEPLPRRLILAFGAAEVPDGQASLMRFIASLAPPGVTLATGDRRRAESTQKMPAVPS
ncbi:MAG: hypothetical protein KDB53_09860 [Planctomycetes bacterium]|nr:hypothetical protein [Planctomycetota bacterium]